MTVKPEYKKFILYYWYRKSMIDKSEIMEHDSSIHSLPQWYTYHMIYKPKIQMIQQNIRRVKRYWNICHVSQYGGQIEKSAFLLFSSEHKNSHFVIVNPLIKNYIIKYISCDINLVPLLKGGVGYFKIVL